MLEQNWNVETDIEFRGKQVRIQISKQEMLSNDWVEFGARSNDATFLEVFGKNPIPIAVKPKQEFRSDYDLFQNTPEQIELCRQIWNAIQQAYFSVGKTN